PGRLRAPGPVPARRAYALAPQRQPGRGLRPPSTATTPHWPRAAMPGATPGRTPDVGDSPPSYIRTDTRFRRRAPADRARPAPLSAHSTTVRNHVVDDALLRGSAPL